MTPAPASGRAAPGRGADPSGSFPASAGTPRRFTRYVAIGDSSTEGLDDPDGRGHYRGWADRLAQRLAEAQGGLAYANLAVRGRRTGQVRGEQLDRAIALRPDLVTLFTGTNDVVARRFDADRLARDVEAIHQPLIAGGATLLTFTLPDLTPVMPLARLVRSRILALNEAIRRVSAGTGAVLLDFARIPMTADSRLWSGDRLHANSEGHARIAAALAAALGVPGTGPAWDAPLPSIPEPGRLLRLRAEVSWVRDHLLPWAWRHLRGRTSGDGIGPKRPDLTPVEVKLASRESPP